MMHSPIIRKKSIRAVIATVKPGGEGLMMWASYMDTGNVSVIELTTTYSAN